MEKEITTDICSKIPLVFLAFCLFVPYFIFAAVSKIIIKSKLNHKIKSNFKQHFIAALIPFALIFLFYLFTGNILPSIDLAIIIIFTFVIPTLTTLLLWDRFRKKFSRLISMMIFLVIFTLIFLFTKSSLAGDLFGYLPCF